MLCQDHAMAALSLTMVDADGVEKAKGSQANEINKKPPW